MFYTIILKKMTVTTAMIPMPQRSFGIWQSRTPTVAKPRLNRRDIIQTRLAIILNPIIICLSKSFYWHSTRTANYVNKILGAEIYTSHLVKILLSTRYKIKNL